MTAAASVQHRRGRGELLGTVSRFLAGDQSARRRPTPSETWRGITTESERLQVVKRLEVAWGPDVRATYQETFSAARGTSYSLSYEPDVSLHAHGRLHLFDAKFRLERPKDGTEEGSFRQADLDKMHAYRDAIRDARSAWVLYPGTEAVYYNASSGPSLASLRPESEGAGALPLRPSDGRVPELDRVLRGLLGVSMSKQLGEVSAQGAA